MKLLSAIKKDMEFNANLYNLLEVLKEIAIAQYRILEKKVKKFDDIYAALDSIQAMFKISESKHPILNTADKQPGIIALTSDAGLLGGLNMSVMSQAIKEGERVKGKLYIIGEKGEMYAKESGLPYVTFKGVSDETKVAQAQELRDYIFKEALNGRIGELKIVYPQALSIVSQQVKIQQLIPFASLSATAIRKKETVVPASVILESPVDDIVEYCTYLLLGYNFLQVFNMARLAELSARFIHLESSKTKIEQLNKDLRLQYFRQRHELVDKNMRELFAARLAFK
ncbi:MAG: F0F1 ATP synthase subunit gamma [Candidatus Omnitrophica bacterium]|jgi:ATP synthase F1 gamma subunit|nr:F0F1 ATP synthase subunit gamma [Candidatus Omnitrophota bacterium]MDD5078745.1 F0F1 ATP synthase subunit gamma [Candidatus Omnitrophota bacterium]